MTSTQSSRHSLALSSVENMFKKESGRPLTFSMLPCKERGRIRNVIEKHGGQLTSVGKQADVRLTNNIETSDEDHIHIDFVLQSDANGYLLDIESFRIRNMRPPAIEQQGAVLKDNKQGRHKYSKEDDEKILDYLQQCVRSGDTCYTGGNALWKKMEQEKVTDHSWQSMRHHYLHKLKPVYEQPKNFITQRMHKGQLVLFADPGHNPPGKSEKGSKDGVHQESTSLCLSQGALPAKKTTAARDQDAFHPGRKRAKGDQPLRLRALLPRHAKGDSSFDIDPGTALAPELSSKPKANQVASSRLGALKQTWRRRRRRLFSDVERLPTLSKEEPVSSPEKGLNKVIADVIPGKLQGSASLARSPNPLDNISNDDPSMTGTQSQGDAHWYSIDGTRLSLSNAEKTLEASTEASGAQESDEDVATAECKTGFGRWKLRSRAKLIQRAKRTFKSKKPLEHDSPENPGICRGTKTVGRNRRICTALSTKDMSGDTNTTGSWTRLKALKEDSSLPLKDLISIEEMMENDLQHSCRNDICSPTKTKHPVDSMEGELTLRPCAPNGEISQGQKAEEPLVSPERKGVGKSRRRKTPIEFKRQHRSPKRGKTEVDEEPLARTRPNVNEEPLTRTSSTVEEEPVVRTRLDMDEELLARTRSDVDDQRMVRTRLDLDEELLARTRSDVNDQRVVRTRLDVDEELLARTRSDVNDQRVVRTRLDVDEELLARTRSDVNDQRVVRTRLDVDEELLARTRSDVNDQRVVRTMPDVSEEPLTRTSSTIEEQPVVRTRLDVDEELLARRRSDADDQRVVRTMPDVSEEPLTKTSSTVEEQPVVRTRLDVDEELLARTRPDVNEEPLTRTSSTVKEHPVARTKSDLEEQRMTKTRSNLNEEPVAKTKSDVDKQRLTRTRSAQTPASDTALETTSIRDTPCEEWPGQTSCGDKVTNATNAGESAVILHATQNESAIREAEEARQKREREELILRDSKALIISIFGIDAFENTLPFVSAEDFEAEVHHQAVSTASESNLLDATVPPEICSVPSLELHLIPSAENSSSGNTSLDVSNLKMDFKAHSAIHQGVASLIEHPFSVAMAEIPTTVITKGHHTTLAAVENTCTRTSSAVLDFSKTAIHPAQNDPDSECGAFTSAANAHQSTSSPSSDQSDAYHSADDYCGFLRRILADSAGNDQAVSEESSSTAS